MKKLQLKNLRDWLFIGVMLLGLATCTTLGFAEKHPMHSFSFDTRHDSPDAEVLDYRYGSIRYEGVHPEKERVIMGQHFSSENTFGPMPRGDYLYVSWCIKSTKAPWECIRYYEDKVDLRKRLPANITGLRVHFVINGSQLYVYLISPVDGHPLPDGPVKQYSSQKQIQIYPDQPR